MQERSYTLDCNFLTYRFFTHFHPHVARLKKALSEESVSGLQALDTKLRNGSATSKKPKDEEYELYELFFDIYKPVKPPDDLSSEEGGVFVDTKYPPVKELDFSPEGSYSIYNWELFYHLPITVAIHLSKNQRFEEAQRWFHYVFDPTDDSDAPTPERFWKVKAFQTTDVNSLEEILKNLSTQVDDELLKRTTNCINAWRENPFRPHGVARYRPTAYMYKTVMAYLDNLIAWGDSLFRQDTLESTNEATQLYILAANLLGPRPQAVPKKGSVRPMTYAYLKNLNEDVLGNVLVDLESEIPFDLVPPPAPVKNSAKAGTLTSIPALYFCIPRNDKLLSYWDTVADRLFKIRNSLNIQGAFRQLPLFEPPIDPALLARATAAGVDIGAVVSGLNQPLPLVRFQFLIQKAAEICQEVKSLGNNLLGAIEKEDNEALAILRSKHESTILGLAEVVKYSQLQEAIKAREGLAVSFNNAEERYTYYERLLGKKEDEIIKKIPAMELLKEENWKALRGMMFTKIEVPVDSVPVPVDIVKDLSGEGAGKKLSAQEVEDLGKSKEARDKLNNAASKEKFGAGLSLIPDVSIAALPFGVGLNTLVIGGSMLAKGMSFWAGFAKTDADQCTFEGTRASKIGNYATREREWIFQSNSAAGEINQILKQFWAGQLREAVAQLELDNHPKQIENAKEIEYFLDEEDKARDGKSKRANKAFYAWMKREVKGLYGQVFQFAFDIAKKAERALQHELGNSELSFIQYGYLDGKEGLLAGEKLYLDIKRMEMAYHELNQREYELTKHASLLQVDPRALIQLRTTGRCTVFLPEELFDMDCPGHYFRRIKSVAVSIPCITGPYASVNCTLTLLKSSIRTSALLSEGYYGREGAEDARFNDYFGSLQSIVTSVGQNDSGLFETNLRDERYLPFEGSGVISEWQLQLPANPSRNEPCQFDYNTISDVILHLRYTAREAGGLLRNGALANLTKRIEEAEAVGSVRLFSVRHEFPSAWAKFKSKVQDQAEIVLLMEEKHYPFWSKGRLEKVSRLDIFAKTSECRTVSVEQKNGLENYKLLVEAIQLDKDASLGDLRATTAPFIGVLKPIGETKLIFDNNASIEDLWLALTWGKEG